MRSILRIGFAGAFAAACVLSLGTNSVSAQTMDCMAPPPSDQDLTLIAAYAASPPAVDEIAFTMETENIMYNTYGGDLMQYVSVWYPEHNTCGAGVNQEGEKQSPDVGPRAGKNPRTVRSGASSCARTSSVSPETK